MWSPHYSSIAWHGLSVLDSGSFTFSIVVLNAANITDSRLKGEKAATKPAFRMKMTLILSTAQVQLPPFIWTRVCRATAGSAQWSTAVEVRGDRTRAETFWILPWFGSLLPSSSSSSSSASSFFFACPSPCFSPFSLYPQRWVWIRIARGSEIGGGVCADLLLLLSFPVLSSCLLPPLFVLSSPLSLSLSLSLPHLWYSATAADQGRSWGSCVPPLHCLIPTVIH